MESGEKHLTTIATVVYALQVAGFFLGGITWLIGVIVEIGRASCRERV